MLENRQYTKDRFGISITPSDPTLEIDQRYDISVFCGEKNECVRTYYTFSLVEAEEAQRLLTDIFWRMYQWEFPIKSTGGRTLTLQGYLRLDRHFS